MGRGVEYGIPTTVFVVSSSPLAPLPSLSLLTKTSFSSLDYLTHMRACTHTHTHTHMCTRFWKLLQYLTYPFARRDVIDSLRLYFSHWDRKHGALHRGRRDVVHLGRNTRVTRRGNTCHFIYLFKIYTSIFGHAESFLLCGLFSSDGSRRLLLSCGAGASHFGGFSGCRAPALEHRLSKLWLMG